jgi:hypothetical protein
MKDHAMLFSRHLKLELSVMAILCTLAIFFFSAPAGPYSVVHGPVTALQALRASLVVFWSMVMAAFSLVALLALTHTICACSSFGPEEPVFEDGYSSAVLRC